MDPSKEKNQEQTPPAKQKSKIIPIILIVLLFTGIGAFGFYFYTGSQKTSPEQSVLEAPVIQKSILEEKISDDTDAPAPPNKSVTPFNDDIEVTDIETDTPITTVSPQNLDGLTVKPTNNFQESTPIRPPAKQEPAIISICNKPEKQIDAFYTHLDKQPYMVSYKISESSKIHFSNLIIKLLKNPPQVTRESDDLYTILKNTAHFFRVSGKDNILIMKGILDNEKASIEQILSDYYLLVSSPECDTTSYGNIDKDALYEYACFFLNTMGGRLYLFRRDSLSRMVVTYYAILLVDRANIQNNNRHGIALRPAVNMLISEMEAGGSSLKGYEIYLDKLYNLKEKYQ